MRTGNGFTHEQKHADGPKLSWIIRNVQLEKFSWRGLLALGTSCAGNGETWEKLALLEEMGEEIMHSQVSLEMFRTPSIARQGWGLDVIDWDKMG